MPESHLVFVCEICQTILDDVHHCKTICPNCGRMFDCSDLPLMHANARVHDSDHSIEIRVGSDPRDWLPLSRESVD